MNRTFNSLAFIRYNLKRRLPLFDPQNIHSRSSHIENIAKTNKLLRSFLFAVMISIFVSQNCFGELICLSPYESRYQGGISYNVAGQSDFLGIPIDAGLNVDLNANVTTQIPFTSDIGRVEYQAVGNYNLDAFVKTEGHKLRLLAKGSVTSSGQNRAWLERRLSSVPSVSGSANLNFVNQVFLRWTGSEEIPNIVDSGINLNFQYDVTGEASFSGPSPFSSSKFRTQGSAAAHIDRDFYGFHVGELLGGVFGEGTTGALTGFASTKLDLSNDGNLYVSEVYGLGISIGGKSSWGSFLTDSSNTIELQSVTFADGSTPESHGFEVSFANGLGSPNVQEAVVPEPSSLTLLSFGALCLGIAVVRRNQRKEVIASFHRTR